MISAQRSALTSCAIVMLVFQRSDLLLAKLAHEEQQRYSINISRYYLLCIECKMAKVKAAVRHFPVQPFLASQIAIHEPVCKRTLNNTNLHYAVSTVLKLVNLTS